MTFSRRKGERFNRGRIDDGGSASQILIQQITAYGPAQWIRFTTDNVTRDLVGTDTIAAATDLSGNARHASQATKASQPLFANPGANFDGTDDYLTAATAFLHGISGSSIFTVFDLAGDVLTGAGNSVYGITNGGWYALAFGAITGSNGFPEFGVQDSVTQRAAVGPGSLSGATGRFLVDGRGTSGSVRCWTNGVQGVENVAAWTGTSVANRPPYVGGLNSGLGPVNRPFPGTIQDVLVFTTALSLADQAAVRALLAQLDGVTL